MLRSLGAKPTSSGRKWTRSHGRLHRLHHEVYLLTLRIRERERTILENASTHSLVLVGKGYIIDTCANIPHHPVVRWIGSATPFAQDRPALIPPIPCASGTRFHRGVYWCTICGQIAQHAAGKKSRAIGLVNECPGHLTRAGRDVLARIERGHSPKASADWPLMRDTVSVNTVSTPNSHPGQS